MALSDNQLQQATAHLEHAVGVQLNNIILPYSPLCNDSLYFKSVIQVCNSRQLGSQTWAAPRG